MNKIIAEGKHLNLNEVAGWEYASRKNNTGVVSIIATQGTNLILVKQFRKPVDNYVIEFPAGLIDGGENPYQTAKREMLEETGMEIDVYNIMGPCAKSPGMTNELTYIAYAEAGEEKEQDLKDNEKIEVIKLNVYDDEAIETFISENENKGILMSNTVAVYIENKMFI
jgi:ADP-ribose pyrophosphatase